MKPFNLEAALAGAPVWHINRNQVVRNVTRIGDRVAFQIPDDGETVYSTSLTGAYPPDPNDVLLFMAPTTKTIYINLWDSPSFHYTKHNTREEALGAKGLSSASKSLRRHEKLNPEPIAIIVEE